MSDRCSGCTNKYGFFERPRLCPECKKSFCQTCLPNVPDGKKKKKKSQPLISQDPCVYCSKQKYQTIVEEAEILDNFQERFYKHSHTEPPIQSTIHKDITKGVPGGSGGEGKATVRLKGEDKALEERLKKLKDSGKASTPTHTEEEIRERLSKLRGETESTNTDSTTVTGPSNKTQVEQARDLIEKATDEVRIEGQVDEMKAEIDNDLFQRFQALKGKSGATQMDSTKVTRPDINVSEFLDSMEFDVSNEDPEKLLEDLQNMQYKEERAAITEVGSSDVQSLISKAKDLAREEEVEEGGVTLGTGSGGQALISDLSNISYPDLDSTEGDTKTKNRELSKLVSDVMQEIEEDKERVKEDSEFLENASERLSKLRGDEEIEAGDVVRSKLDHPQNLDISWTHFGQPSTANSNVSAAHELGLVGGGGSIEDEESDTEVKALIDRMVVEAKLDDRLEASGFKTNQPNNDPGRGTKAETTPNSAGYLLKPSGDNDDYPWCCICNEDATLRCYDCDDDLYCTRCFSEGHEQFGLFDHRYAPYEQKKE